MNPADEKKIDQIADDFMLSIRFLRRMAKNELHPGIRGFDPSRLVLAVVLRKGPLPMSSIGRRMGFSKPYMTSLIDRLIEEGLVERVPDKSDRRIVIIQATEAGRDSFKRFRDKARQSIRNTLSALSSEDLVALQESMGRIVGIISKLDSDENGKCER